MSHIFTLKSNNHVLSIDFAIPIELDPSRTYGLALIGFHAYNSIPNIEQGCNKFYYYDIEKDEEVAITIPVGSYEISDIENYLRQQIIPPELMKNAGDEQYFSLKANNNTLCAEIQSNALEIDFHPSNSIGKILGFSPRTLESKKKHTSDLPVNIINVRTIHIDSNITAGATASNGQPSHTIYEFAIDVDPGFAIDEIPKNLIYLPVINKTRHISNLTLTVLDQNQKPVNFRGEEIIIRLELKPLWD